MTAQEYSQAHAFAMLFIQVHQNPKLSVAAYKIHQKTEELTGISEDTMRVAITCFKKFGGYPQ
tara:strand:- start:18153 stop:18341 length:189 start_codon:yes stop_codon:yes gene_type:complete